MERSSDQLTQAERYKLLIGCIVPRPIAVVSTISPAGEPNVAPFSFYAGIAADPMSLLFCPSNTPTGDEKDTLRNAKPESEGGVGEFVVNVAVEPLARPVAAAAEPLPYGQSEFELAGLTPAPSRVVRPPRVAESPVCFECRTIQVVRLKPGAPSGGNVVIGRVVHVYVRDDLIDERMRTNPAKLAAFGRMGGLGYCLTRDRFDLPMGRAALDLDDPTAERP